MSKTQRLAIYFTVVLVVIIGLVAQQLIGVQNVESHGDGQNDHTTRAWTAGSRCISPEHLTRRHAGSATDTEHQNFNSSAYAVGAGNGTGAVEAVEAEVSYIGDQWEANVSWKAPGFHNDIWACQPYAYVIQRKIGNGNWEHWESERRYPATVESSKRHGELGGHADYSTDTTSTLGTLSTTTDVYYRVCGVSEDPYDVYMASSGTASDLATFTNALRSCVTSNVIEVGGEPWKPTFSRVNTNTFNEGNGTIYVTLQSSSNPPRTTTTTIKWIVNTEEGSCNVAQNDNGQTDISFSTSGFGILTLSNPNLAENTFEDDCQVTYRLEQKDVNGFWRSAGSVTVYVEDTSPLSIEFSTLNTDPQKLSEDGSSATSSVVAANNATIWPNQLTVNVLINGATTSQPRLNCPELAAFTQTISSIPFGGADSSDYSLTPQELTLGGLYGCAQQFVVRVNNDGNAESSSEGVSVQFDNLKRAEGDSSVSVTRTGTWASSRSFSLSFVDENYSSKVGVGFAGSSYTARSGDPLTVRVYGYDYADSAGRSECDTNSLGESVDFKVKLYDLSSGNSSSSILSESAQVRYSCYTDVTLQIPNTDAGEREIRIEDLDSKGEARNNDTATVTVLPDNTSLSIVSTASLNEGASQTVSLRLTSRPTDDVTVSASGNISSDLVLSPNLLSSPATTLTFTSSNWNRSQTLTITANQDNNTRDSGGTLNFRTESNDARYDGETARLAITVADDDSPTIRFTSFQRPILYRDDKVAVKATFPHYSPNSTDACYINYIEFYTERTGLMLEEADYQAADTVKSLVFVPYDPNTSSWTVEETHDSNQNLLYREYSNNDFVFRHYENGRDSIFTWNDPTPSYARAGTIKFYALGNATACHDGNRGRVPLISNPAGANDAERKLSCRSDANCQWVDYTAD